MTLRQYYESFERADLIPAWPGPNRSGKGDAFPADEARSNARGMLRGFSGRRVVFVGRGVAQAFGLAAPPLE